MFRGKSTVLGVALILAAGSGGITGIAQAHPVKEAREHIAADVTVQLPAPTGPHRVGVTTLYLVDRTRRDPWADELTTREVMATVFYPARTVHGYPLAHQMTRDAAASFAGMGPAVHPELPATGVNWAATTTHSYTGAPAQAVRRPVVLYSPGGGDPRTMGTGVAEELAAHGYVVVTIDHPGDAGEVDFPVTTEERKEKIRETVLRGDARTDPELFRTMIDTRIADARFVLDQLEILAAGRNPDAAGRALPQNLGRALDLRRVGMYGHSAGGTTAAQTMYEDRRVDAAVNLEGYLDQAPKAPGQEGPLFPVARNGVDRPLLLLGSDGFLDRKGLERSWSAMLAHPEGHTHRRQLDNAAHGVFTDYAALAPQLQAAGVMTADNRVRLVGAIDPASSVPAVRDQVLSFFARHLPPAR
ncbi:alpha/beta hydrolase [Streptomyces sp. NPDC000410]|uniref:alpha/beta hydrolase family protein n=1 Tax=Streptomyces sp. NPDC000410 TaxID=3154254 RepID=UPI00331898ED